MPEDKNAKTVDIDTSGPEVDVEFEDTAKPEPEFEVKEETVKEVKEEKAPRPEKLDTSDEKPEPGNEKKDELEDYSEGVQRRIAKLTKKCEKQNVKKMKQYVMLKA